MGPRDKLEAMRNLLISLLLFSFASQAGAWGPAGHRIVADLAQRQLRPSALAEAQRLLAGEAEPTLAGVSSWADELREADRGNASVRWHYINFHGECAYVPARDCADGNCVIAAINRQFLVLADRRRPDAERRDALKFLVHLVGDVHQPLHASSRTDKGGNDFQISLRGKGSNLHSVWDREIIGQRRLDPLAYADLLSERAPLPADPTGGSIRPAVDWALESCKLVETAGLYPPGHVVDEDYLARQQPIVETRLRQAGARLANMINVALAPGAPVSADQ
jgi:hypothetical protein